MTCPLSIRSSGREHLFFDQSSAKARMSLGSKAGLYEPPLEPNEVPDDLVGHAD